MSVRSSQAIVVEFVTSRFDTGAATNADSTPAGTLVVNGVDNAASVTVTNIDTGRYKAAVTLPTLAVGDIVELSIAATVNSVAGKGIVWRDSKDVLLDSSGEVTFNNTSIATVTTVTNQLTAAQIATGVFQDTTAGDFTVAGSIGKSLFTSGNVPGAAGGLFVAGTNAATTITTSLTTTFTGNLTGSVGSVTGGVTVTTNNDKTGYSLTQAFPANFSSFALTAGGAVTVGTNSDKTGYSLTQSFPTNFAALGISVGGHISNVDTLTTYTGDTPQTGDAFARIGVAGAGLTALGDTRIAHLDADVSSRLATVGYTAPPSVASIADGVWDEAIAGHLGAGSTGAALNAAGSAGDPWTTVLPGAYGAGTAGNIVGVFLDVAVSGRASATVAPSWYTAPVDVSANVTAIKAKTDNLPADPAGLTTLASAHGAGSWATATGFAVAGDAMSLTAGTLTTITTDVAGQVTTDHGSGSYLRNTEPSTAIQIADAVLLRDVANVEGTANDHSLCYLVLAASEASVAGTVLTVKKTDGSTTFSTKTLTVDAAASPVTGVS